MTEGLNYQPHCLKCGRFAKIKDYYVSSTMDGKTETIVMDCSKCGVTKEVNDLPGI